MQSLFDTDRLSVRRVVIEDADFVLALLTDPGFLANVGDFGVRTAQDARAYIRDRIHASYARHRFGMYRVALKTTDAPVGMVGLMQRDFLSDPDIAYGYLAAHTRRGYGYEAARGLIDWAFQSLNLGLLTAMTNLDNEASAGLLLKLGFEEKEPTIIPDRSIPMRFFVKRSPPADADRGDDDH